MAEIIATRPMTVLGKQYKPGDAIPAAKLKPERLKQLIDQRRATESRIEVNRGRKGGD